MKHKWYKCNCGQFGCQFCDGGLASCTVCHGGEGTLTTDCCGRPITPVESDKIYKEGTLDFRNGQWVAKPNYPRFRRDKPAEAQDF